MPQVAERAGRAAAWAALSDQRVISVLTKSATFLDNASETATTATKILRDIGKLTGVFGRLADTVSSRLDSWKTVISQEKTDDDAGS